MRPYYSDAHVRVYCGDAVETLRPLPDESVQTCVTSPPYWGLRSYLPDVVRMRADLSPEDRARVAKELESLGIFPTEVGV